MARASEQFRQSDVALWGIVALVCGGIAIVTANLSAAIPDSVLAGLHVSRLGGTDLNNLRAQVASLEAQTNALDRKNAELSSRFDLAGLDSDDALRRIGALELTIPKLNEAIAAAERRTSVDRSTTASIGEGATLTYDADGGSVSITQTPWLDAVPSGAGQPMPQLLGAAELPAVNVDAYGIALGPSIKPTEANAAWTDLSTKLGPLLFGMSPILADESDPERKRLVAGPLPQMSDATAMCTRMEQIGISCLPVPYSGTPLAN